MIRNALPDGDYLRSIMTYEPDTGLLRWLVERGGSKVGDIAGAQRGEDGYIQISIDRKLYRKQKNCSETSRGQNETV